MISESSREASLKGVSRAVARYVAYAMLLLLSVSVKDSLADTSPCARIVSLAPSVTEVLFDLGLGDRVVGVTRFCRYPPEAQKIEKVGGFYDVSVERVVLRHPTDVFFLSESAHLRKPLEQMGLSGVILNHRTLSGIRESYALIGKRCGVEKRAAERLQELANQEEAVRKRCNASGDPRFKRTLVVVGRTREGSQETGVYISGRDGYYSELLAMIGAVNVRSEATVAVPSISAEGILHLNPDVILEVINVDDPNSTRSYLEFWKRFKNVPAVSHNKVFLLTDDYASIPGPRYILLAQKLSDLLCG